MRLLLDTHVFVWFRLADRRLGRRARSAIERDAVGVRFSVASAWELAIKGRSRGLQLPDAPGRWIPHAIADCGFELLPITLDHALAVDSLPAHHGDPFDRLLIAQAQIENLTIVTADAAFESYDVKRLDARA